MPAGFRNPFRRNVIERRRVAKDMTGDPDITRQRHDASLRSSMPVMIGSFDYSVRWCFTDYGPAN